MVVRLSPIVLFVYNRLEHTKKTVEALKKNDLADQSDLIIYADGTKNAETTSEVQEVRDYIETVSGFKSLNIVKRDENLGLAENITDGVTDVLNRYGKVIVMEDDIVTSPGYLQFMNRSLEFYEDEKKVWHISGWNYPIKVDCLNDVFLWRVMNCWGWATWVDRWSCFERCPKNLINEFSKKDRFSFNLDGTHDFWSQVEANQAGMIKTWAIFWYATIFKHQGLCLNPVRSLVQNIGKDGTGVHCQVEKGDQPLDVHTSEWEFTKDILEHEAVVRVIKDHNRRVGPSRFRKILNEGKRFFRRIGI